MRLLKTAAGELVIQFGRRETRILLDTLALYPLIPSHHHRLSRTAEASQVEADQRLLEEAMAAHKAENHSRLKELLRRRPPAAPTAGGWELALQSADVDWFLHVLNDIRVGSWLKLGCPDEQRGRRAEVTPDNARYYVAMELCGLLQASLLRMMDGRSTA